MWHRGVPKYTLTSHQLWAHTHQSRMEGTYWNITNPLYQIYWWNLWKIFKYFQGSQCTIWFQNILANHTLCQKDRRRAFTLYSMAHQLPKLTYCSGVCGYDPKSVNFKHILGTDILNNHVNITLGWMIKAVVDCNLTMVQVMHWCHQAASHYLNQCWLRSTMPYDVTRLQWLNTFQPTAYQQVGMISWKKKVHWGFEKLICEILMIANVYQVLSNSIVQLWFMWNNNIWTTQEKNTGYLTVSHPFLIFIIQKRRYNVLFQYKDQISVLGFPL